MPSSSASAEFWSFIGANWWWLIWVIPSAISWMFEGVRDFIIDTITEFTGIQHKRRMQELKAERKAAALIAQQDEFNQSKIALHQAPGTISGICLHPFSKVKPVVPDGGGKPVAWLCTACDEQLPADWAIQATDVEVSD
jgi:hypothetical protein